MNPLNKKKGMKRERNSEKTKIDILKAAEKIFSEKGFHGARIDKIANMANINKRMIYQYFLSKENLYKKVLEEAYLKLSLKELDILGEDISFVDAIKKTIRLYFEYLSKNTTYVNLILWENLNKGKYIESLDLKKIKGNEFYKLKAIIQKAKDEKIVRPDIDADQIILSILTYTFSYFSNMHTLSKLIGHDLKEKDNINKRIDTVTEMFLKYLLL